MDLCDWYHGRSLTRLEAEEMLVKEFNKCKQDGVFLVRDSTQKEYKFVLSIFYKDKFKHFPIKQHGGDAFYSIDGTTPIHGMDELIKFYQKNDSLKVGLLKTYVKGSCLPHEYRLCGKQRLLHRAVSNNNFETVKAMVPSSDTYINSKDETGKTALHLACITKGNCEIIKLLINNDASLLIRDADGNIPFHYACQNGFIEAVKLLIATNKKVIHVRNSATKEVALHIAAKAGKLEVVKELLDQNAPHMPRNAELAFPIDLAQNNNHTSVVFLLKHHRPNVKTYRSKWYHGTLTRDEAFCNILAKRQELYEKLQNSMIAENAYKNSSKEIEEMISGIFLVRFSENVNSFVITVLVDKNNIKNYPIKTTGRYFYIDQGPYLMSLEHLITHYLEFSDGLEVKLSIPVEPQPKPPVPIINPRNLPATSENKNPLETTEESRLRLQSYHAALEEKLALRRSLQDPTTTKPKETSICETNEPVDYFIQSDTIQTEYEANNLYDEVNLQNTYDTIPEHSRNVKNKEKLAENVSNCTKSDDFFIENEELEICKESLGSGEFGSVNKGILKKGIRHMPVAIKTLHTQNTAENFVSFLREAGIMMKLDNPYIVRMIGINKGPPLCIVQELLASGSLEDFLKENSNKVFASDVNLWASQIAEGMEYLETRRFVHRDLATRNILLASPCHAKISDFGLSRTISIENNIYNSNNFGRWPLRWYAPECFEGKFSHSSDVWSFAVTLWEMYSRGCMPYDELEGREVVDYVKSGHRLTKPILCNEQIYKVMWDCWNENPIYRPNFQYLAMFFKQKSQNPPIYENEISKENDYEFLDALDRNAYDEQMED